MPAYRKFHNIEDELGNKVELREEWVNPEKDIWRWKVYRIENPGSSEVLHSIGNVEGMLLATALSTAAGHFKMLRENWIENQVKNKYSLDWSKYSKVEQQILAKFKALYELAGITPRCTLDTGIAVINNYIRRLTQARCNLEGSRGFAPGVYVYPSGVVNVQCNCREFNLTILDPVLLNGYYRCVLQYAKQRLPHGEKLSPDLNMTAFRRLVKERQAESKINPNLETMKVKVLK